MDKDLQKYKETVAWRSNDICEKSVGRVFLLSLTIIAIQVLGIEAHTGKLWGVSIKGLEEPILIGCLGWVWLFYIIMALSNYALAQHLLFKNINVDRLFEDAKFFKMVMAIFLLLLVIIGGNILVVTLAFAQDGMILVAQKVLNFLF